MKNVFGRFLTLGQALGLTLGLALCLTFPGSAQTYFNRRYALGTASSGLTVLVANDSGYLAVGSSDFTGQADRRLALPQYDVAGTLIRTKVFSRPSTSFFSCLSGTLMPLPSGGYALIVGRFDVLPARRSYAMLWRLTAAADTLWTRTYSQPTDLIARNGCRLPNGDLVVVGSCERPTPGAYDWFVLCADSLGNERWRHTYRILDHGEPLYALATPDGGILVTGYARVLPPGTIYHYDNQLVALKLDAAGTTQWQRIYGAPGQITGGPALATPDGGYLVGGEWRYRLVSALKILEQPALYKLDAAGNMLWHRRYGPAMGIAQTCALHALPDGSYLLAGNLDDSTHRAQTNRSPVIGYAQRVCANGDSIWYRNYRQLTGISSNNYMQDMVPTRDGGFAGAGFLHPFTPDRGTPDAWLFKTDQYGYLQAGGAPPSRTCVVGLPEPAAAPVVAVWPNPAPDGRFTVQATAPATYTVTDVVGRTVAAGALRGAETPLDLRAAPAGIYLLRLTWPTGRTSTHKLLR